MSPPPRLLDMTYFQYINACPFFVTHHAPVTCADLQLAAAAAGSSDTVGVLTGGGVSCDAWTTFEVTHNKLKLVAPDTGFNADHTFVFENVRFLVSSGVLRVDPEVSFSTGASGGTQVGDCCPDDLVVLLCSRHILWR